MKDDEIVEVINRYTITTLRQIKAITETHLTRIIAGSLRNCIEAHGPITLEFIGSAAKRIANTLLGIIHNEKRPIE